MAGQGPRTSAARCFRSKRGGVLYQPDLDDQIVFSATLAENWLHTGAYDEISSAGNLFAARVGPETSNASSLRAGASLTRHITPSVDATVSAAIGRTFGEAPILADVDFIGPAVGATDDVTFGQFGARLGVKLNDSMTIGTMTGHVLYTPGHTPACTTHVIGNAAFVGDTLFMPDAGSGRADFPGGDAATLYHSIQRLLTLPDEMRLFMCHDYGPNGRDIRWETTVGEERRHNVHVRDGVSEAEFVAMRQARDATLAMPRLIIPSLQVNMRAGQLPRKDDAGKTFLKVPVNEL
ncbi:MAG: MBL fold metallo-hydrolase [Devosia sp.]